VNRFLFFYAHEFGGRGVHVSHELGLIAAVAIDDMPDEVVAAAVPVEQVVNWDVRVLT
jgi:hypothetical protein